MQIVADKQGFSVRAFQEQWFYCPVVSAVDADGKSDWDDPYVPVLSFAQEQGADGARYIWRTHSNLWEKKEYVLEVTPHAARYFVRMEGAGAAGRIAAKCHNGGSAPFSAVGANKTRCKSALARRVPAILPRSVITSG